MDLLSFFLTGTIGCVQIGYAARDAQNDSRWKIIAGCLAYIGAAEICGIFFPNQMIVGLIWQIALVYGVSALIFRAPAKTAAMDALLAVCLTQLCVGIGSSAQSLLLPPLYGTSALQPACARTVARYNQTRALRHDMRNHLLVVDGLLQTSRVAEGQAYLEKLHAAAELSSLPAHTGNPIVDVLIEGKLAKAREENVDVEIEGALPLRGGLDDFDLCVLVANAFDNALEACRALSARRWIRFSCKCRENLCLLSFENSCRDVLSFREATGLGNIRSVAEKYNGAVEVHTAGGVFTLRILLSTSELEEDNSERLH